MKAGIYSGLNISNLNFAAGVRITSADALHEAVLTNFHIGGSSGLNFSQLEVQVQGSAGWGGLVESSQNISFDHMNVHGSLDGNPQNDAEGIGTLYSSNISITNSEFQQLCRGVGFGTGSNLTISGNNFHDLRTTGVVVAQAAGVAITDNSFSNFKIVTGDHPDAIQFLSQGATAASHDITISGNLIDRGSGDGIQGIFLSDEAGNLPYANVTISDNMLIGAGYNGVAVLHGQSLTITNNTLISYAGDASVNWLLVKNADTVVSSGNSAISIGFDHVTNLTETGDIHNAAVTDGGAASLAAWMTAHPGVGAGLSGGAAGGGGGAAEFGGISGGGSMIGDAGADTLIDSSATPYLRGGGGDDSILGGSGFNDINGNAGNDVIDGGAGGGDWLVGGQGDDLVKAHSGQNILYGNLGNDTLLGGSGGDLLRGGQGDDSIVGGVGGDWISGDRGNDTLSGGAGADIFHTFAGAGVDRVLDFHISEGDRVQLEAGATYTVSQVGADTVIDMGHGDEMILVGIQKASLTGGWLLVA